MAQGPSDTILVAIQITLRIRESEIRILRIAVFGGGLCSLSISSSFFILMRCLSVLLNSVMWHPSGDSSTFITLADSHILVCDIEPSGKTAKVCCTCILH